MLTFQMWNVGETFNDNVLKTAVMEFVDSHLEELLKDNLLEFLGFEEVHEILSRPKLGVWSQKYVCDSIIQWILQKQSPAEDMDDQEVNMIAEMKFRLRDTFANMTELYFDKKTISHLLPVGSPATTWQAQLERSLPLPAVASGWASTLPVFTVLSTCKSSRRRRAVSRLS